MNEFNVTPKAESVHLLSWLDLNEAEQKEMDHVGYDEQGSNRFFYHEGTLFDVADFMLDDRAPEWQAGYPLNAFAMLMIRLTNGGEGVDIGLMH